MQPNPPPEPDPEAPAPLATDELDAVVGGRKTRVQDAHDKYANSDSNY